MFKKLVTAVSIILFFILLASVVPVSEWCAMAGENPAVVTFERAARERTATESPGTMELHRWAEKFETPTTGAIKFKEFGKPSEQVSRFEKAKASALDSSP